MSHSRRALLGGLVGGAALAVLPRSAEAGLKFLGFDDPTRFSKEDALKFCVDVGDLPPEKAKSEMARIRREYMEARLGVLTPVQRFCMKRRHATRAALAEIGLHMEDGWVFYGASRTFYDESDNSFKKVARLFRMVDVVEPVAFNVLYKWDGTGMLKEREWPSGVKVEIAAAPDEWSRSPAVFSGVLLEVIKHVQSAMDSLDESSTYRPILIAPRAALEEVI